MIDDNLIRLIENTREHILTQKISLPQAITSVHYIAQLLEMDTERTWAERELDGNYKAGELPDYRTKLFCTVYTHDASSDNSKKCHRKTIQIELRVGIGSIVQFLDSDKEQIFIAPSSDDVKIINHEFKSTLTAQEISLSLPRGSLTDLVGGVNLELSKKLSHIEKFVKNKIKDKSKHIAKDFQKEISRQLTKDIFIVHGHDVAAREETARFIEKIKLHPIILKDQVSGGRTTIEKFIEESASSSFAVVLFTPDDKGFAVKGKSTPSPRPRQNVIFELGYFISRLGRKNVVVLIKKDVEMLSDFKGVIYIDYDENGAWKTQLAKEMKNVGIEIDMNDTI